MTGKIILGLQVSGFILASLMLLIPSAPHWSFVLGFAIHLAGDLWLISIKGLPDMPFDLSKYVKVSPFFQFVGLALATGGLLALSHWFGKPLAYFGIFMSFAGFIYDKIYT